MALTEAQVVILYFTVPTTCSMPSIEMVRFMYLCIYLLLCRLLVVGPVLKWLALFMYLFIYVFLRVLSPGHTFGYFWLKFVCRFVGTV